MPKYLDGAGLSHFWESIKPKLGGVVQSGTGTVVTSDDAANLPPLSLTIHGKSVQDGIPSPSSPVAIESIEGLSNLLRDTSDATGNIAHTRASAVDGNIRLTPTGSAAYAKWVVDYLDYQQYSTATLTASFEVRLADVETSYTRTNGMRLYYGFNPADRDDALFSSTYDRYGYTAFSTAPTSEWERRSVTFTIPTAFTTGAESALAAGSHLSLEVYLSGSNKPMEFRHLQLEVGETLTPWGGAGIVLSDNTATPIDLQGNALRSLPDGTEDALEVDGEGNVTLTQRVGSVDMGTLTWQYNANGYFYATVAGKAYGNYNIMCTDYAVTSSDSASGMSNGEIKGHLTSTNVFAKNSAYSDAASFKAAVNGILLWYGLATPQTISLGKIDLPSLPSPSFSMHVDALATPTLDAEWWTQGGGKVIDAVSTRITALESEVDSLQADVTELQGQVPEWEVLYDTSTWTIAKYGRTVMVNVHGATATPSTSNALVTGILADYKPAHNYSATVLTSSSSSTQAARMAVYADTGNVYIVPAGYSSSASWYGTLTYIY